jgi:hypothetical protein
MKAGVIANRLQDSPAVIACCLHARLPSAGGSRVSTVTARVISASVVSSGAQRAQRQELPKDGRRR